MEILNVGELVWNGAWDGHPLLTGTCSEMLTNESHACSPAASLAPEGHSHSSDHSASNVYVDQWILPPSDGHLRRKSHAFQQADAANAQIDQV
mmetsp:Transcript_51635/g.94583  ORF Transcript_51635/g.94583 Transcript_51635/m.94583 type:complete len:93 (+) Transcript_51635:105-383(+)